MHHFKFKIRLITKNVAARCDFGAQNTPKCVCGRGFGPGPHWGSFFTAPPDPIGGFHGALRGRRGEARKGQGREGEDGKGRGGKLPQFFFLQFHCWTQSHTTS